MTDSKIIFDVAAKPFTWLPIWSALGALVLACIVLAVRKLGWWRSSLSTIVAYIAFVMVPLAIAYYSAAWFISRHEALSALATGHYEVVQGPVEDFHPMPDDASSPESFKISGHKFSYSDEGPSVMSACFNKTAPHGGPIRAGMMLRVKFADNCILHVEELAKNP